MGKKRSRARHGAGAGPSAKRPPSGGGGSSGSGGSSSPVLTAAGPTATALPKEVLLEIFSYLTLEEIMARVLPVCGRWRQLAYDGLLDRSLTFRGEAVSTADAVQLLRAAPDLQSLEISARKDAAELLKTVARRNKHLRRLVLRRCRGGGSDTASLALPGPVVRAAIEASPTLLELTLKRCMLDSDRHYRDLRMVLPLLRRLNVSNNWWAEHGSLRAILRGCGGRTELKEVRAVRPYPFGVQGEDCCDADVIWLTERANHSLTVVKLQADLLSGGSWRALGACRGLRALHLANATNLGYADLQRLASLPCLESFKVSRVWDGVVSSADWSRLFAETPQLRCLRSLGLPRCGSVDDEVLTAVAAACCPGLEKLDVSRCNDITEYGVEEILRAGGSRLRRLRLRRVRARVAHCFPSIPVLAPGLLSLDFCPTAVGFAEHKAPLARLRAAMPHLVIRT